jgi:AhpD family alkylhydroperoxidase
LPRLTDAPLETTSEADARIADRIRARRGGRLRPLDRILLHSPPVADGWNALLGAVRTGIGLPDALRELVILRIAVLNDAPYEWSAHEPVARRAGVTGEQLAALRASEVPAGFEPRTAAALAYTDAMTREIRVSEEVFAMVRAQFDDRELVELTVTAAAYNMVSRCLVALEIGEAPEETR